MSLTGQRPEMSFLQRIDSERKEEKQRSGTQEQVKQIEVKQSESESVVKKEP